MSNEIIIGEILAVVIAVGLPIILNFIFKWSKRYGIEVDKEQEEYIIKTATNSALDIWNDYTSNIKKYSIDGKLTEEEKEIARNKAIDKAKNIITNEFKKAYKRGDVDKLIEGAMENIYSTIKKRLPRKVSANKKVVDAINMGLKIAEDKYRPVLKKSMDEGEIPKEMGKIIENILEISKNFMDEETIKRIDNDEAGNKDRANKIILREMYKNFLHEKNLGSNS
jgi:hypothetical protein